MIRLGMKFLGRVGRGIRSLFPASHYALLAIFFMVGLEFIFALQRWMGSVTAIVLGVMIIGVVALRAEEGVLFRPSHLILPALATTGLGGFAFLLPATLILHVYILVAGLVLFFLLKHGARAAYPVWNWVLTVVIYFLNIGFILGLWFHLYIPILLVLAMILVVSVLLSFQSLRRVAPSASQIVMPTLGMGFVLTELTWVLLFLPSHYLVQASILTIVYYVLFNLLSIHYTRGTVARRDYFEYLSIGIIASLVILFSAKWT